MSLLGAAHNLRLPYAPSILRSYCTRCRKTPKRDRTRRPVENADSSGIRRKCRMNPTRWRPVAPTANLPTSEVLYRLSYAGAPAIAAKVRRLQESRVS